MYSVDDLKLTAYERKLPEMMYKPIIAPLLAKRAFLRAASPLSSGADVGLLQGLEALLATGTRSSYIRAIRATCDGQ